MEHIFFHIDVNSAFLSWTAVDNLKHGMTDDLRLIPAIIGGDVEKRHGIVLAKSIPAKKYNIQTGEPIVNALRKCPNLLIVPPDITMYRAYSHQLFSFLSEICPQIEQLSIDECYMDYTPIASNYASPYEAACQIRDRIYKDFGFTVNIGISDRKVLAKMASDFKKPNLVHTLYQSEIAEKMWPLPVSELYMCGKSSVQCLYNLGILTIGELAHADLNIITAHLKSHGKLLWEYANGYDTSVIEPTPPELKGVGNSITLSKDADTIEDIRTVLLHLAESVSGRLRKQNRVASMISVEIKYSTFQTVSHQTTLSAATNSTNCIFENACHLLEEVWNHSPIRLLGIRTSKLLDIDEPTQLTLFDYLEKESQSEKQKQLDSAIDSIRDRFGAKSIMRGSLLDKGDSYSTH